MDPGGVTARQHCTRRRKPAQGPSVRRGTRLARPEHVVTRARRIRDRTGRGRLGWEDHDDGDRRGSDDHRRRSRHGRRRCPGGGPGPPERRWSRDGRRSREGRDGQAAASSGSRARRHTARRADPGPDRDSRVRGQRRERPGARRVDVRCRAGRRLGRAPGGGHERRWRDHSRSPRRAWPRRVRRRARPRADQLRWPCLLLRRQGLPRHVSRRRPDGARGPAASRSAAGCSAASPDDSVFATAFERWGAIGGSGARSPRCATKRWREPPALDATGRENPELSNARSRYGAR